MIPEPEVVLLGLFVPGVCMCGGGVGGVGGLSTGALGCDHRTAVYCNVT